ncbi:MAG: VanZ family protein [Thermodesulfovibrionia bacterium]
MKTSEKNTLQTAIIFWFFAICYMGIIFYFSSLKGTALPELPQGFDKIIHAGIYAVLAFLIFLSLNASGDRKYVFLLSIVIATIYGVTDEFHQLYVPGRETSIGDIIADFIGAFSGSYLARVASLRRP